MAFTETEWDKIVGDTSEVITAEQARELLDAPSGSRPRVYGLSESGVYANQIIAFRSIQHLDDPDLQADRFWVSHTTFADLVSTKIAVEGSPSARLV